jgi:iron complex outermembrane receptor protein
VRSGLRLDSREDFAPTWAPSLSAGWSLSPALNVRAAVGRSFRAPTWTDRFYEDPANRGDPDLAVETAWSSEAGIDISPAVGGLFRLTAFVREARDLIDYARPSDGPDDAVWQTRNVESASFRGVELEVGGVAFGPVALDGALELLDVESDETGAFISKYALRPLTRSAVVGARVPLGARVTAALRVENRQRTGEADRTAADLRLEARIGSSRFWLDATNLGDARWLDVSGRPAPGRSLRTGVSVEFGGPSR